MCQPSMTNQVWGT